MSHAPTKADTADDVGLSLIELIVVVVIVGILSGVIVMILVNSWTTQEDVSSTTVATNEGQVYASSIERAVRNSDDIYLSSAKELIVWRKAGGAEACHAFKFSAADATDESKGDAGFIAVGAGLPAWAGPTIRQNVSTSSSAYFVWSPEIPDEKSVTYSFKIGTDASPVVFSGRVSVRNPEPSGVSPCWP